MSRIIPRRNPLAASYPLLSGSGVINLDTTPNLFSFIDQTNVSQGTLFTSNSIQVLGLNYPSPISVSNGEYSINGGAFTSLAGLVVNGDQVRVRHTSSASPGASVNTLLTIGGVSDIFTTTTSGIGGASPNPLYPALDMATIPYHNGAGLWGPQVLFETATLPLITRSVNASNTSQLAAALAVPGSRITITASMSGAQLTGVNIRDVEMVIPNGILVNGLTLCGYQSPDTLTRFKVTKNTGDAGIGGRLHRLQVYGAFASDIIFDGIQMSASLADPSIPAYIDTTGGGTRHAYLRSQLIGPAATYGYGVPNLLVAGCSALHDANNVGNSGDWGFRCSKRGAYIFYQNDIRGSNYSHIRFHPDVGSGGYVAHIEDNTFLDRDTADFGRTVDIFETDGTAGLPGMQGAWLRNNRFYVNGSIFFQIQRQISGAGNIVDYLEVVNNIINGSATGFAAGSSAASNITGNTYNAAPGADPAWAGAGDPSGINWNT